MNAELAARIESLEAERLRPVPDLPALNPRLDRLLAPSRRRELLRAVGFDVPQEEA